jgi:predicted AlkP superfamily pyrophosphatase or phosphodiesterase
MDSLVFRMIWLLVILIVVHPAKCYNYADFYHDHHHGIRRVGSEHPLLLLVSFDGFRWDYLNHHNLTNFNRLKIMGSHADYIYNSFSTVTFPNHWTIVTGLYEESHGIVQNNIYDPVLNKTFSYTSPDSQTHEWFGQNPLAEPIWATNQRAGGNRLSVAEWVGANVIFNSQHIINIPYNKSTPYKDLIDRFIHYFIAKDQPVNFGALYFDEPDHTGHLYGPYSQEMKDKLQELDKELGYMLDQLETHGLFDRLNLIITSDHGMDTISSKTSIFLDSHIDTDLFNAYGSRACYSLFVKKASDIDYVYTTLKKVKNIDVYKKNEIPKSLYYKMNVRIGDLVIVTQIGYAVYINNQTVNWTINNGDHGYYNNESTMFPIFMAHGPAFKKGFKIKSFKNVDIYPLMCYVLGIEPATHNGSLSRVLDMIVNDHLRSNFVLVSIGISFILFIIVTAILFSLCFIELSQKLTNIKYSNNNIMGYKFDPELSTINSCHDDKHFLIISK